MGGADAAVDQCLVDRAVLAFDEEERDLWKQLKRRREFSTRIVEKRALFVELQHSRTNASKLHAEALASIEQLSAELEFMAHEEREFERDIAVLKESNRILQGTFGNSTLPSGVVVLPTAVDSNERARTGVPVMDMQDVIAEERAKQESAQLQHEQIEHLRGHLQRLATEKSELQQRQQALCDKQRAAEQDRNRLLSALQDDRKTINDLRQDRLVLWEERHALECELARIVQDAARRSLSPSGDPSRSRWAAPARPQSLLGDVRSVPVSGGVRVAATVDEPIAFSLDSVSGIAASGGQQREGEPRAGPTRMEDLDPIVTEKPGLKETTKSNWTKFEAGSELDSTAVAGFNAAAASGDSTSRSRPERSSSMGRRDLHSDDGFGSGQHSLGGTSHIERGSSGRRRDLHTVDGFGESSFGGITEWAPKLEEFKHAEGRRGDPSQRM